jgi:hopene-associated glycosyltransferase HpnB
VKSSPFLAASLSSLAAWAVLLAGRGGFWRARPDAHVCAAPRDLQTLRVEAVVPARDEAETIGRAIASLVGQRFAGRLAVTLVDDGSADGTAVLARAAALPLRDAHPLEVIPGRALPPGWSGKLSALATGTAHVLERRGAPDYWLFCDADIAHDPHNVAALARTALADDLDLVSLMVLLRCESGWERLLVPAFVFFFAKLYPFAWANDPRRRTAAAAGGCILLSHDAFERIGGFVAIRHALIDDCALAAAVKRGGGRTWLGLTARTHSLRRYDDLATFRAMVARTAFAQLQHRYALVGVAAAGLALLYLVPPVAALAGLVRRDRTLAAAGLLGWIAMAVAYAPTLRLYRRPSYEALGLPVAAALYGAMTVESAAAYARKRGGRWKGRTYEATSPEAATIA